MANLPVPALCQFCPLLRVEWSADHHSVVVSSDQRNVSISDKDRGADIVISIGNAELPSVATIKVTINVDGKLDGLAKTVAKLRKLHNGDDDADDVSSVSLPSTIVQPTATTTTTQAQNRLLQEENRRLGEENLNLQIKLKKQTKKQPDGPEKTQAEKKQAASGFDFEGKGKGLAIMRAGVLAGDGGLTAMYGVDGAVMAACLGGGRKGGGKRDDRGGGAKGPGVNGGGSKGGGNGDDRGSGEDHAPKRTRKK